jgi:hypothetical protein
MLMHKYAVCDRIADCSRAALWTRLLTVLEHGEEVLSELTGFGSASPARPGVAATDGCQ